MVLSEDRLQIKWKEADGPVQGYKVHMRPISGETFCLLWNVENNSITMCEGLGFIMFITACQYSTVNSQPQYSSLPAVPQPELMLTTTRGRATVAGLDSSQEYALRILILNGTTEKLLAKRQFTSKKCSTMAMINLQCEMKLWLGYVGIANFYIL